MTKAARDRILKDVNGDISDHLRNHIHLTNCIHLKNHMHKHSPILADKGLMRDLVVLQRSRSLRDPSASPPSWHSGRKVDLDEVVGLRQSVSVEPVPVSKASPVRVSEDSSKDGENSGVSRSSDESGQIRQDRNLKTLSSDRLKDIPVSGPSRAKRRRFRGARRSRPARAAAQNEMSVASNSLPQGRGAEQSQAMDDEFQENNHNVTGDPKNGCGIPWNWSRIHHRGKSILDIAGRSLSCGLSESRSKRGGSDMPVMSERSTSSTKSEGEALPLLLDASGSQGSINHGRWIHDYSGELGIFADNLLKPETDSDLSSEGRSHEKRKFPKHENLTQKYMPKTFRDLIGQNLVGQALSNAIVKHKVSLLYLFYGPHGTGKTSCARIFAKALNCQSVENPKPCGFCNSCIGKNRNIREIGPVSKIDFEGIIDLLDSLASSQLQSQYRVVIFDECDSLSSECWSAILKVIDRAPRRVIFILVCSSIETVPHVVISRCQKFFFPKQRDADIIYTLQWISTKEGLEIDKDALKLIASRSDGSLRDAEMTLEQLSLLGKRISLSLVQELVGLISDEKLIDLLDSALSADTVNTVKNLRDVMESGVEPLALMSQLATVITDILAGSYDFMKERGKRKFFRRQTTLSKQDMEKLRQALKTLSEAEKQLRVSSDRITWLTAALLQLAPDQQYVLPSSSTDTSLNHSQTLRERPSKSNAKLKGPVANGNGAQFSHQKIEEIWSQVVEKIPIKGIKEFVQREGKLASLNYGAAPAVQLMFGSQLAKSKAEKFRLHILQAFELVLRSPVTIEIRCESNNEDGLGPILLPATQLGHDNVIRVPNRKEIIEIEGSPKGEKTENSGIKSARNSVSDKNPSLSLVRGKVSLAQVIQQVEGRAQHSGWSKKKAVSIAEKIEQENLRLESRSSRLLCWNPPRSTRRKLSRLKIRTRKPQTLLKFVSCGRCLSGRSPRSR